VLWLRSPHCSLILTFACGALAGQRQQTWTADNGNGTSQPLFYEEFSDPELIRVGTDYYLTGHDHARHAGPSGPALEGSGELGVSRLPRWTS